jgi:hypothetical protein
MLGRQFRALATAWALLIRQTMRIAVVAAVLVGLTGIASAQAPGETMSWDPENPPGAGVQRDPQTITINYRRDVMLADGLWVGALLVAGQSENEDLAGWSVAGYFLAAPIVHIAHGRGVQGLQSFGLRAGLPLVGGMIGYRLGPDDTACDYGASSHPYDDSPDRGTCGDHGSISGMLLGGVAGGITAIVLDWKYLTKYQKTITAPAWSASIKPTRGGATFGVSGTF